MSDLSGKVERLRAVKTAFQEFIQLWAIDRLMDEHASSERIAGDVLRGAENSAIHGFSGLYAGRGLDD